MSLPYPHTVTTLCTAMSQPHNSQTGETMAALGVGMAEVAVDLSVLGANSLASSLLQQGNLLALQGNKLACHHEVDQRLIKTAVTAASQNTRSTIIQLKTPNHDELSLVFQNDARRSFSGTTEQPYCLLYMRPSLASQLRLARQLLGDKFGITTAESEVLSMMVRGLAASDIAATRKTSNETIRSQIKNLCAKTGSSGQVGLVAFGAAIATSGSLEIARQEPEVYC